MKKSFMTLAITLGMSGCAFGLSANAAEFPSGYPFNFWSDARVGEGKSVVTGRFEQGIEMAKINGWKFIPFAAAGANYGSNKNEYWNNEFIPEFGVKVTHGILMPVQDGWGNLSVGLRLRRDVYFGDENAGKNFSNKEMFIQLGFGGDWKSNDK